MKLRYIIFGISLLLAQSSLWAFEFQWDYLRQTFRLAFAQKQGIAHRAFIVSANIDEARMPVNFIAIEFPQLTAEQYKELNHHYGGNGNIPWDPQRKEPYRLVDFLPIKMQALANCILINQDMEVSTKVIPDSWQDPRFYYGNPDFLPAPSHTVAMCCWDAVYEVCRQGNGAIFHIGAEMAEKLFLNEKMFTTLKEIPKEQIMIDGNKASRNDELKPGDIIYIKNQYSTIGPAHVAIWLDDDLYYEKPNSYTEDPFRLARYEDVISPYLLENGEVDETIEVSFLRRKKGVSLPPLESFAGIYPYGENEVELSPEVARDFIFSQDVGLGGGLSIYNISKIERFSIAKDNQGRYIYKDAEKYGLKRLLK